MLDKFKSFIFFKKKSNISFKKETNISLKKKTNSLENIKSLQDLNNFQEAKLIFSALGNKDENKKLMFVGGCVRKLLNKELIKDIDIATTLTPDEIKHIFKNKNINFIETGVSHGTITAIINEVKFEITTLRKDVDTDGRHANVEFISDWEKDAQRRDITINAIYSNLQGQIYDPLGGSKDLENGIVKFIGDPHKRIKEDYLRILRYFRFYTQYSNNQHHDETIKAIKKNLDGIIKISKERILDELFKILSLKNFDLLFKNDFSCSVILSIFPQLKYYDRFSIIKNVSSKIINRLSIPLILSILLIDHSDNCKFFLYKFKFSNKNKDRILFLLNKYKEINFKELLDKKLLIKLAYLHNPEDVIDLLIFSIFVSKEIDIKAVEKQVDFLDTSNLPVFPITGDYLKLTYGFSESKELGLVLKKLEKAWIENNFVIDKNEIKNILKLNKN